MNVNNPTEMQRRGIQKTFPQRKFMDGQQVHEKCSASLVIRGMELKTQPVFSLSLGWLLLKRQEIMNRGKDVENGMPCLQLVEM